MEAGTALGKRSVRSVSVDVEADGYKGTEILSTDALPASLCQRLELPSSALIPLGVYARQRDDDIVEPQLASRHVKEEQAIGAETSRVGQIPVARAALFLDSCNNSAMVVASGLDVGRDAREGFPIAIERRKRGRERCSAAWILKVRPVRERAVSSRPPKSALSRRRSVRTAWRSCHGE